MARLLIAAILFATNVPVQAQDLDKGRNEFLSKCAGCHGADAKGAGPMTSKLKRKPADLTVLAKNNNDVFSADAIAAIIDGRGAIRHSKCQFGDVGKDLRRAGKGKPTNLHRLNHCWICLASLSRS